MTNPIPRNALTILLIRNGKDLTFHVWPRICTVHPMIMGRIKTVMQIHDEYLAEVEADPYAAKMENCPRCNGTGIRSYYWSALGNEGEEDTEERAITAARNWITREGNPR